MSKEAMKLALDALENNRQTHYYCEDTWYSCPKHEDGCANESEGDECNCGADKANVEIDGAITALREALANEALDKMAENARELGLDYEPSAGTQVSKVWWDGERLMAKPIPLDDFYEPAQQEIDWKDQYEKQKRRADMWVAKYEADIGPLEKAGPVTAQQEFVAYDKTELNCFAQDLYDQKMREGKHGHYESMFHVIHQCVKKVASPPQRTWVGLTDDEIAQGNKESWVTEQAWQSAVWWAEAKLKEKNMR